MTIKRFSLVGIALLAIFIVWQILLLSGARVDFADVATVAGLVVGILALVPSGRGRVVRVRAIVTEDSDKGLNLSGAVIGGVFGGSLSLRPTGLSGNGAIAIEDGLLESRKLDFEAKRITADSAGVKIRSGHEGDFMLVTDDVSQLPVSGFAIDVLANIDCIFVTADVSQPLVSGFADLASQNM